MADIRNRLRCLALCLMAATCLMAGCRTAKQVRIEQLKADIRSQLPPVAGAAEVIAWLDRNHIEHSEYTKAWGAEGLRLQGAPGRIDGVINKAPYSRFARPNKRFARPIIGLIFLFDQQGKMLSYEVFDTFTGPQKSSLPGRKL